MDEAVVEQQTSSASSVTYCRFGNKRKKVGEAREGK